MARRPPPVLGVQDDPALTGSQGLALLDAAAKSGVKAVRANVIYGKVKTAGGYDFSKLDALVNAARARGLAPQFTLMSTPRYNPDADQALSYAHNDPKVWKDFAQAVAAHFKGRVGRYSIGNEMNHPAFLAQGERMDPASQQQAGRDYRNIYRAGYAGVKAADRGAQVLLGEVTSGGDPGLFLKGVLGGKPIKTAGLAYHPYDLPGVKKQWSIDDLGHMQGLLGSYKRQGKLQTAAGAQAPLYLTEFGYKRGSMPEGQRQAKMAQAYRSAEAAGARELVQYQLLARPTPTPSGGYGGGTPTPSGGWDSSIADNVAVLAQSLAAIRRAR